MRRILFITILLSIYNCIAITQNSLDDLNIIFSHDFENNTLGNYLTSEFYDDFPGSNSIYYQEEALIVNDEADLQPTKSLQVNYHEGTYGNEKIFAAKWYTPIEGQTELYFSYDIKFEEGFEYGTSCYFGKIPSVGGGDIDDPTPPDGYNSFTSGLAFRAPIVGLASYIYTPDAVDPHLNRPDGNMNILWGYDYETRNPVTLEGTSVKIPYFNEGVILNMSTPHEWHNITVRTVLNTITNGEPDYNGLIEGYYDGKLIIQISNIHWRSTEDLLIDVLRIYTHMGGLDDCYKSPKDQWIRFDNFMAYTFKDHMDVPRGNELSSTDRTINHWRTINNMNIEVPEAPDDLRSTSKTSRTVTLRWSDNSDNEAGFKLYGKLSTAEDYVVSAVLKANQTSYTDDGLYPDRTYNYKILAYNSKGNSTFSEAITITTAPPQIPEAPSDLKAGYVTPFTASLSWSDNSDNESSFRLQRSKGNPTEFINIKSFKANTIDYVDSELEEATTYFYRIRAQNEDGNSSFSNILEVTTLEDINLPANPSSLSITRLHSNEIEISWQDNSNNENGFEISRSMMPDENFTIIDTVPGNETKFTDINIRPSTIYNYKVRALNDDGYSSYTNTIAVTTPAEELPPVAPSNLVADSVSYSKVFLKWSDNSLNENSFVLVRYEADQAFAFDTLELDANTVSYTDTLLFGGTNYLYKIAAKNTSGMSSFSEILPIRTLEIIKPEAPSALKAAGVNYDHIVVSWKDNSENEDFFRLKREIRTDLQEFITFEIDANDTLFADTLVSPNTTYKYTIEAVNLAGTTPSNEDLIATTLSFIERYRYNENLIAYYNFSYNSDNMVYDLSGYKEPLNLKIQDPESIVWDENHKPQFISQGLIVSEKPAKKIVEGVKSNNEISIECWLKPKMIDYLYSPVITQLSLNNSNIGFLLSQDYALRNGVGSLNYNMRLQTSATSAQGYPSITPFRRYDYSNLNHLVYTRDSLGNEYLFVNGENVADGYRPEKFNDWSNQYFLTIGSDLNEDYPWYGSIYSLAIYNSALTTDQLLHNYSLGPCDNNYEGAEFDFEVKVKPNVITNNATIEIKPIDFFGNIDFTYFRIYSAYGILMHEETLTDPSDTYSKIFNFEPFPKGIYFLEVTSGTSSKTTRFFVR